MNVNKLYFVEKYGQNWELKYKKWAVDRFLAKPLRYTGAEFKREYIGALEETKKELTEMKHDLDALRYAVASIKPK